MSSTTTTTGMPASAIASFTFAGAPNNCSNPTINSTSFISGVALKSTNNIDINVNVITVGTYEIHTDTLDGIFFSTSGKFTNTGSQTVTLTGNGTPEFSRYLSFSLSSSGIQSCTFNITVLNPQPLATYVLESGNVNNVNQCIYTLQGIYTHDVALNNSNTVAMRVYVTVIGNFTISTNTINGITLSYTGSFTTTGSQYVILTGSGTPVNQGTYTFFPNIVGPHPLGGESCAFDIDIH